ncbi:MAG: amidohydrolase family protein [Actinomycetales bacterium]|nr:amidohydrolase family protein [Actinomycetales bacterium]
MRALVDAHLHTWDRSRHPQPWIDPTTMAAIDRDYPAPAAVAELAALGVSGCVAVQCVNEIGETVDLLADAGELPSVRGVVGWLDLTADVPAQVQTLRAGRGGDALVGVRHVTFVEPDERWLARADVGRGLAALADAGLTYDLLIAHHQLRLAAEVARRHPSTGFVLDHLGKVPMTSTDLVTWARDLAEVATCPNVAVKVSGVVTEDHWDSWTTERLRPVVEHALETFGPQRMLFGSDWPLVELAGGYRRWLDAYLELTDDLTESEREAIDGGNAIRVYGLR